jgi:hypothetical protein
MEPHRHKFQTGIGPLLISTARRRRPSAQGNRTPVGGKSPCRLRVVRGGRRGHRARRRDMRHETHGKRLPHVSRRVASFDALRPLSPTCCLCLRCSLRRAKRCTGRSSGDQPWWPDSQQKSPRYQRLSVPGRKGPREGVCRAVSTLRQEPYLTPAGRCRTRVPPRASRSAVRPSIGLESCSPSLAFRNPSAWGT